MYPLKLDDNHFRSFIEILDNDGHCVGSILMHPSETAVAFIKRAKEWVKALNKGFSETGQ